MEGNVSGVRKCFGDAEHSVRDVGGSFIRVENVQPEAERNVSRVENHFRDVEKHFRRPENHRADVCWRQSQLNATKPNLAGHHAILRRARPHLPHPTVCGVEPDLGNRTAKARRAPRKCGLKKKSDGAVATSSRLAACASWRWPDFHTRREEIHRSGFY